MRLIDRIVLLMASAGKNLMPLITRQERKYLKRHFANAIEALPESPQRADDYLYEQRLVDTVKEIQKIGYSKSNINRNSLRDYGLEALSVLLKSQRDVKKSFVSLGCNDGLAKTEAAPGFYAELKGRARDYGVDLIGFTRVPANYIFKDKRILFPNAIVCAQEMKREYMEMAPEFPASVDIFKVYANMGDAMNRLADFIRSEGIPCQVSHPMIGEVLYTALGARAGLGYFGRHGLLITPEFGVRQRLGAILLPLEDMPWTDSDEHEWILDFCDQCNLCIKHCPGQAIHKKVKPNVPGIYTSIDNMRCMPWFTLYLGCSICVKYCPFSRKPYDQIKQAYESSEVSRVIEDDII